MNDIPDHWKIRHIGDGVYASFDGYQVALFANSPTEPTDEIYLPDFVMRALVDFWRAICDPHKDTDNE